MEGEREEKKKKRKSKWKGRRKDGIGGKEMGKRKISKRKTGEKD